MVWVAATAGAIFVLFAVFTCASRYLRSLVAQRAPNSWLGRYLSNGDLRLIIRNTEIEIDDQPRPAFAVDVSGMLVAFTANSTMQFVLHIFDITNGDEVPVISGAPQFQESRSIAFEYRCAPFSMQRIRHALKAAEHLVDIPVDFLQFPRSGMRRLKFVLHLLDCDEQPEYHHGQPVTWPRGSVTAISHAELGYEIDRTGYHEQDELTSRAEEIVVRVAMGVSAADGDMNPAEGSVIRNWLERKVEIIESRERQTLLQRRYNMYVVDGYKAAREGSIDPVSECRRLLEISHLAERYDALELCLRVASADGVATQNEIELLSLIGRELQLDLERVRDMRDRLLPMAIHADRADYSELLGIMADMPKKEIRKRLTAAYRKWNQRVTHTDETIRKQAEEMLKVIVECREELLDE